MATIFQSGTHRVLYFYLFVKILCWFICVGILFLMCSCFLFQDTNYLYHVVCGVTAALLVIFGVVCFYCRRYWTGQRNKQEQSKDHHLLTTEPCQKSANEDENKTSNNVRGIWTSYFSKTFPSSSCLSSKFFTTWPNRKMLFERKISKWFFAKQCLLVWSDRVVIASARTTMLAFLKIRTHADNSIHVETLILFKDSHLYYHYYYCCCYCCCYYVLHLLLLFVILYNLMFFTTSLHFFLSAHILPRSCIMTLSTFSYQLIVSVFISLHLNYIIEILYHDIYISLCAKEVQSF